MKKIDLTLIILYIFLIIGITSNVIPMILGFDLSQTNDYQSFLSILNKSYINFSYFGKVVISNLDYMHFHILSLIQSLIYNLSYFNLIVIGLSTYLICAKDESVLSPFKKPTLFMIFSYLIGYLLITLMIMIGFRISTLNTVIILFHYVGYFMIILHLLMILTSIYTLFLLIKKYFLHR